MKRKEINWRHKGLELLKVESVATRWKIKSFTPNLRRNMRKTILAGKISTTASYIKHREWCHWKRKYCCPIKLTMCLGFRIHRLMVDVFLITPKTKIRNQWAYFLVKKIILAEIAIRFVTSKSFRIITSSAPCRLKKIRPPSMKSSSILTRHFS